MERETFDDFIKEVIQRNDIVSVVSKYVPVERRGRYYWCRCPFHGEKTPSLCVNDIDNFFYCFGCHVGGTVVHFVMKIESLSYMEAVKTLAGWANMEIPSNLDSSNGINIAKAKKRKDRLLSLMKDTARHYHENLAKPYARVANEYMKKRQIDSSLATRFGVGYADGFYALIDHLRSLGYSDDEMLATGVVKKKESKLYDPQADRLIFPIIDIYGDVVAFGGRILENKPEFAKYLNTAETELFNKRNTLYAINYLKKQRQHGPIPYVIVVEGYMDTVSLHKAGFTMTVASMGTALTQAQAKLIKRFADKVYICYDGDSAGQNATLRGLDILKDNGLDVMVVQLPDKFDPDDVIKTYGKEGYQKLLDEALPLVEFKLKFTKSKYELSSVDGRVKYLNEAINILATISDSVERELYIPMVGDIANTNVDFIRRELDNKLAGKEVGSEIKSRMMKIASIQAKVSSEEQEEPDNVVIKAEKYILFAMIHEKPYAFFKTDITYLFSGVRREIYNVIVSAKEKYGSGNLVQKVLNDYSGDDVSVIADIINQGARSAEDEKNEKKYYDDCLWIVYSNNLKMQLKELMDEHSFEVDTLRKKEIEDKMRDINNKLTSKKVENL